MKKDKKEEFMALAIETSNVGIRDQKGGPFGAVIVKNGKIISVAHNEVTSTNDPTAHAETVAIRRACKELNTYHLEGCEIYCSCEPCPMCMGAIYWARIDRVYYACTREDAAKIGFDDYFIYEELNKPLSSRKIKAEQLMQEEAMKALEEWRKMTTKKHY